MKRPRILRELTGVLFTIGLLASERPGDIPDPAALLREAKAHQHTLEEIRDNYTFHRVRRVDEVDDKGVIKKTTIQEREVFYVNGRQIGRLLKTNGVVLNPQEEKAEQARVRKVVEEALKTGKGKTRSGMTLIGDILAVSVISNPRRLMMNGRSTLAFDFKGDPKAKVQNSSDPEQNAAKKMAGTLWFDETDRQVARLELVLDDNFKIGGGLLANVRRGTKFRIDQAPVGQGLWMQTASETSIDARIVVKSLREKVRVEDSDFKRFDVETLQKVGTPGR